ncbi:MAG TPA: hypothetical protein PKM73_14035 [Verrucomicrobiota bacterium]|nr:hypothetical protein [Verrucomicrobiota bacterium]HNU53144.1 hypothetical protein [Verrucomicrobiota bacterium]
MTGQEARGGASDVGEADGGGELGVYPDRPGPVRGLGTIVGVALVFWVLARHVETGVDDQVTRLGKIEVTARLMERPDVFPELGAYRYTYVLPYEVLKVHRSDPGGRYPLRPGDRIFVGHYQPRLPRSAIRDADWGEAPLGGALDRWVAGEAHRMALDYELADLAPSGALDYHAPAGTNRFFAIWANPTTY